MQRQSAAMAGVSALDVLKESTVVVADTGDVDAVGRFGPRDATTNPSLVLKAVRGASGGEQYVMPSIAAVAERVGRALDASSAEDVDAVVDDLTVRVGCAMLKLIPGRVSTEVDARLSFDAKASVEKAKALVALYEQQGVDTSSRVLLKLATTWEGCEACRELEASGLHCNMTLVFSPVQAMAAQDAGATLVSPFVGRILDWYVKNSPPGTDFSGPADPGVASVTHVFNALRAREAVNGAAKTEVMGASFRSAAQVMALRGCDLLTVSPALLGELASMDGAQYKASAPPLDAARAREAGEVPQAGMRPLDGPTFRALLNEQPMPTEKLAEGIRLFVADQRALVDIVAEAIREAQA